MGSDKKMKLRMGTYKNKKMRNGDRQKKETDKWGPAKKKKLRNGDLQKMVQARLAPARCSRCSGALARHYIASDARALTWPYRLQHKGYTP